METHELKGGEKIMAKTKTEPKGKELTPATVAGMDFGKRVEIYENLLREESALSTTLNELYDKINELLNKNGINQYADNYQKHQVKVYIVLESANEDVRFIAQSFGNNYQTILSNSIYNEKIKKVIGEEGYKGLVSIRDEYLRQSGSTLNREIDVKASDALWKEYSALTKEMRAIKTALNAVYKQKQIADGFVSYVKDLAQIAQLGNSSK